MNNILMIIKKELDKIFKFPRVFFSTIILPGLIIFLIYSFMGTQMSKEIYKEYKYQVYVINQTEEFNLMLSSYSDYITVIDKDDRFDVETLKEKLITNEIDLVVIFSDNFTVNLFTDDANIEVLANKGSSNSINALNIISTILEEYKDLELKKHNIITDVFKFTIDDKYTDEKKNGGEIIAMLLPMLIITFVFAGTLSIGADAIAGEKERGTLATLLMAPIKRNDIILGKIISTALISIMTATSSIVGVLLALPFAKDLFQVSGSIAYGIADYIQLFMVVIVLGIMSSALILVASTFARTTKEATSYAMPIYLIAILIPTFSMFSTDSASSIIPYCIPIYNLSQTLKDIFAFNANITNFLIALFSSLAYIILLILLLLKMFKSEKVLFSK